MKEFFKHLFTEPNNQTFCPLRLVGVLGTLQGLGMSAFDVFVQHAHFDLLAFGGGLGATLTALGVALGFKKDSP